MSHAVCPLVSLPSALEEGWWHLETSVLQSWGWLGLFKHSHSFFPFITNSKEVVWP